MTDFSTNVLKVMFVVYLHCGICNKWSEESLARSWRNAISNPTLRYFPNFLLAWAGLRGFLKNWLTFTIDFIAR